MDYGTLPQWVTAGVAVAAGVIALYNIHAQRQIARRRASFDLFLKTETDDKMVDSYDNFHKGLAAMRSASSPADFCTSEATRKQYYWVRKYLNVHELVAVGLKEKVLDYDTCYIYWGDILVNNCNDARPILDYVRSRPRNAFTYVDLETLNADWKVKRERALAKRGVAPPPAPDPSASAPPRSP
jgi:hypothetical protein